MLVNRNDAMCQQIEPPSLFRYHDVIDINIHKPEILLGSSAEQELIGVYAFFSVDDTFYSSLYRQVRIPLFLFEGKEGIRSSSSNDTNSIIIENDRMCVTILSNFSDQQKTHVFKIQRLRHANKYIFGYHWKDIVSWSGGEN